MKKALKIALFSVLGLVILLGVAMWMEFGPLVKGANSCVKLDDGLYYMEYNPSSSFSADEAPFSNGPNSNHINTPATITSPRTLKNTIFNALFIVYLFIFLSYTQLFAAANIQIVALFSK